MQLSHFHPGVSIWHMTWKLPICCGQHRIDSSKICDLKKNEFVYLFFVCYMTLMKSSLQKQNAVKSIPFASDDDKMQWYIMVHKFSLYLKHPTAFLYVVDKSIRTIV